MALAKLTLGNGRDRFNLGKTKLTNSMTKSPPSQLILPSAFISATTTFYAR